MSAATTNRDAERQPGDKASYSGASGYTYYKETILAQSQGAGVLRPYAAGMSSGVYFVGVVEDRVDLSGGLGSSQAELKVWKEGIFTFEANGTGASAHIGRQAFAIDDQTVGVSGAENASMWVGEITAVPSTSTYRVRINNAVGWAVNGLSGLARATVLTNV